MKKRMAIVALTLTCILAACSSDGSDGADQASDGDPTTTVAPTGGDDGTTGACEGLTPGEDGVVNTFCDGTASVTFTLGGEEHTIGGGLCTPNDDYFTVNAGVVVDADFAGPPPAYAGVNLPPANGDFAPGSDTIVTLTVDGETTSLTDVDGTHDDTTASFEGTPLGGGDPVTGSITC